MGLETPQWLNAEFMEKVLRNSEKDGSIRVVDVSVKPATNKGDNYASDIHRATVNFTRDRNGAGKIAEKRSVIVKIPPIHWCGGLLPDKDVFETEVSMMSDTLVKMSQILGSKATRFAARSLHAQLEKPTFLVLEDLAPLGFTMADRRARLDLDHCLLVIRGIAKFHASSVALFEKNPEDVRKYRKGFFINDGVFNRFITDGVKALGEQVAKWPELGPRYAEKIIKLSATVADKATNAQALKEEDFNVLNHGDLWVNNMLFRYDVEGKPIDLIFVDFQLSLYTSPAIDLLYFLTLSPSEEVTVNSLEFLLREYQSVLATTMLQLDCKTTAPSYEELKRSMEERAFYEMVMSFTILPLNLNDKSKVKSVDETVEEKDAYNKPAYHGKRYRKTMLRLLPMYEKMGLLDVE